MRGTAESCFGLAGASAKPSVTRRAPADFLRWLLAGLPDPDEALR